MATPTVTIPLAMWQWQRLERLSGHERVICRWVACGLSNREVAAQMGSCERTVRTQVQVIFEKTGARSRTQLAMLALFSGIVDPDMVLATWKLLRPDWLAEEVR